MNQPLFEASRALPSGWRNPWRPLLLGLSLWLLWCTDAFAHGVAEGDKGYIQEITGVHLLPFVYLGAKHMVTGYDHLLFLFGVIFFLYRLKDIGALRHAVRHRPLDHAAARRATSASSVSSYLIDAIIGLSVVYKALDNLGAFQRWFGFQPNTKAATLVFGLFHGFGLATKIQDYEISPDGLVPNLLAFNVGVEIGQLLALGAILIVMGFWRRTAQLPAARLHRQRRHDDRRLRADRLPAHRLLRLLTPVRRTRPMYNTDLPTRAELPTHAPAAALDRHRRAGRGRRDPRHRRAAGRIRHRPDRRRPRAGPDGDGRDQGLARRRGGGRSSGPPTSASQAKPAVGARGPPVTSSRSADRQSRRHRRWRHRRQRHEMTVTLSPARRPRSSWTCARAPACATSGPPPACQSTSTPTATRVNAPKDFYHGYGKGRNKTGDAGTLQAAFDGKHGWFWRNRGNSDVSVRLNT